MANDVLYYHYYYFLELDLNFFSDATSCHEVHMPSWRS